MDRRSFMAAPLSLLGLTPVVANTDIKSKYKSDLGFGSYLKHGIIYNSYVVCQDNKSYISWPIEVQLRIDYEKGYELYSSFNTKIDLIREINEMSIQELLKYKTFLEKDITYTHCAIFDFGKHNRFMLKQAELYQIPGKNT